MHIYVDSYAEAYTQIRQIMLKDAIETKPRGMLIKELFNVSVTLNPRNRLAYHELRKYNIYFNIAELIAIICDVNSVKFLNFFNKNIKQFSDNGIDFNGAYGPRLSDQWEVCKEKLLNDNDTRQAIMTIYDGQYDLHKVTKDVPCTLNLHFIIRENKLNLTVYMRSNDLFWGFQYDIFNFTMIQEMIYNELKESIPDLELGTYTHTTTSLHVYEKHFKLLNDMEVMESIKMPAISLVKDDYEKLCSYIMYSQIKSAKEINECFNEVQLMEILQHYFLLKDNKASDFELEHDIWAKKFLK